MTLSIWRYAHLALAIISSLFLLILASTGVILAIDAVTEKTPNYQVENFDHITLAQAIPALRKVYPEIIELNVDHNKFVSIDAQDFEGNTVKGYIDPNTAKVLGEVKEKSPFIQWTTALHRSLFLKDTGRIIVGLVSFILFLISISGLILIIKRQQGIRHIFAKINRDFFAQYFHVVFGRLMLLPIVLLALTGTYLFMVRMDFVNKESRVEEKPGKATAELAIADFKVFQEIKLSDVEKIEFPFIEGDPEEFFIVKLKNAVLNINQVTGETVREERYAYSLVLEKLSLDLHTGRSNILLAIVLGFASLNIIFFIYSGFVITFRRTRTSIKNKFKAEEANYILLVGSENGSTLFFANCIHKQLLAHGLKSYVAQLNDYQTYSKSKHLMVFTSTFGLGTAPTNATHFLKKLSQVQQPSSPSYSVVGFGSKAYVDYCAYAEEVHQALDKQAWSTGFLPLATVNDKSIEEFTNWVAQWSEKSGISLSTVAASYQGKLPALKKFTLVEKTAISSDNSTFRLLLKPANKLAFESGDLLAIYPGNDFRERLYSIGKRDGQIQLMVKLYPDGLGSSFLYNLTEGQSLSARVLSNAEFHFPSQPKQVVMIANGTGIAPFLGMIASNTKKVSIKLYAGFRYRNSLTSQYEEFAREAQADQRLERLSFAFSREENPQYVMDLIDQDAESMLSLLADGGCLMICGSLQMQRDVEKRLEQLLARANKPSLAQYRANKQILSDCY